MLVEKKGRLWNWECYRNDRTEILQTIMILKSKVSNPREDLGANA